MNSESVVMGKLVAGLVLLATACIPSAGEVGNFNTDGTGGSDDGATGTITGGDDGISASGGQETDAMAESGDSPAGPMCTDNDAPGCCNDADGDGIHVASDNAPSEPNPQQLDEDGDGVGDVIDRCPTIFDPTKDTSDSDRDGVGNGCDSCRQTIASYNKDEANPPTYMRVRNVPFQRDSDNDGIGDVCDNCVQVANCDDFGPNNPYVVGDPISYDDSTMCNTDVDNDMVGDACAGNQSALAAGPVGLGPDDDFDQDGLRNILDACPRQPLTETVTCTSDAQCNGNRCAITDGVCNHLDSDADGVGNICDTCAFVANPMQLLDGQTQKDDMDGDFVGALCETDARCETRHDPRPFAFHEFSANGDCCTIALFEDSEGNLVNARTGNPVLDPDWVPVRVNCTDTEQDAGVCRRLPVQVAATPGILTPPPGCQEALAGTNPIDNPRLTGADFGGDLDLLWDRLCFLPQRDQDFDGVGDSCDSCAQAFDPLQEPYIDDNGTVWESDGRYCNGDYALVCL